MCRTVTVLNVLCFFIVLYFSHVIYSAGAMIGHMGTTIAVVDPATDHMGATIAIAFFHHCLHL